MKQIKLLCHFVPFAIVIVASVNSLEASFVLDITQSGSNVVGFGSGTINTTALTDMGESGGGGLIWGSYPTSGSAIGLGSPSAFVKGFTGLIAGPSSFGSGPLFSATSGEGDPVDIAPVVNIDPLFGSIFVPVSYVSGAILSDTSIWDNTTIADLGLISGTYTYNWGVGATADSFTINVSTSTPEPEAKWLIGIGSLVLIVYRFRNRCRSFTGTGAL